MTGIPQSSETIKTCCAALYESDWARLLIGESLHPGGLRLTERLGLLLNLTADLRVLDVASGRGTSAIYLARHFGCEVVGIDYSESAVIHATAAAERAGVARRVLFECSDAETLSFQDGEFDVILCECAFCTFPEKAAAASEFGRVLRPGGRIGLSDFTRKGALPKDFATLMAWIACIAGAQPIADYVIALECAGFTLNTIEPHDEALAELIDTIRVRLLGTEVLVKIKQLELPHLDFAEAKQSARFATRAVKAGKLGYHLLVATKTPLLSPPKCEAEVKQS